MAFSYGTVWEKIYKDYHRKGKKKGLVEEGIHPNKVQYLGIASAIFWNGVRKSIPICIRSPL
jgi:hypothetical protein